MPAAFITFIVGVSLFLLALARSCGNGFGIFKTQGAYQYPILGRKATRLYSVLQGIFLLPMIIIALFFQEVWIWSAICIAIPAFVCLIYCEIICWKRFF